jgi:hypothetical protein
MQEASELVDDKLQYAYCSFWANSDVRQLFTGIMWGPETCPSIRRASHVERQCCKG